MIERIRSVPKSALVPILIIVPKNVRTTYRSSADETMFHDVPLVRASLAMLTANRVTDFGHERGTIFSSTWAYLGLNQFKKKYFFVIQRVQQKIFGRKYNFWSLLWTETTHVTSFDLEWSLSTLNSDSIIGIPLQSKSIQTFKVFLNWTFAKIKNNPNYPQNKWKIFGFQQNFVSWKLDKSIGGFNICCFSSTTKS